MLYKRSKIHREKFNPFFLLIMEALTAPPDPSMLPLSLDQMLSPEQKVSKLEEMKKTLNEEMQKLQETGLSKDKWSTLNAQLLVLEAAVTVARYGGNPRSQNVEAPKEELSTSVATTPSTTITTKEIIQQPEPPKIQNKNSQEQAIIYLTRLVWALGAGCLLLICACWIIWNFAGRAQELPTNIAAQNSAFALSLSDQDKLLSAQLQEKAKKLEEMKHDIQAQKLQLLFLGEAYLAMYEVMHPTTAERAANKTPFESTLYSTTTTTTTTTTNALSVVTEPLLYPLTQHLRTSNRHCLSMGTRPNEQESFNFRDIRYSMISHMVDEQFDFICAQHIDIPLCYCILRVPSYHNYEVHTTQTTEVKREDLFVDIFDLWIVSHPPKRNRVVLNVESARFCKNHALETNDGTSDGVRQAERFEYVTARFKTLDGVEYERTFSSNMAYSIQQMYDIQHNLNPCKPSLDQMIQHVRHHTLHPEDPEHDH